MPQRLLAASFAAAVLVLVTTHGATAIRVALTSKRAECFRETIDGANEEVDVKFRWELTEPDRWDDVVVTMESPSRVEVYNSGASQHGHYEARAIESGAYVVCFRFAPNTPRKRTLSVQFFWDVLPQGSQLYAHEVSANTVIGLQPDFTTSFVPATSTTLDLSPTPQLRVAALRFDLSAVVKEEDLPELRETTFHAAVRLHVAHTDVPNGVCRAISPRPSERYDPLRSIVKDKSNVVRAPAHWYSWPWADGEPTYKHVPLSLTLLDTQPCHTNRTVELNITDEFIYALDQYNTTLRHRDEAVNAAQRHSTPETNEMAAAHTKAANNGLQLTLFVTSDFAGLRLHSRHSTNPLAVRPQLLIQVSDNSLNSAVRELSANVFRLKTQQTYTRIRERVLRDTTESTNSRAQWFNVMLCGFLAAVSALQILYIKSLVEPKSSLDAFGAPYRGQSVATAAHPHGLHTAAPVAAAGAGAGARTI